MEEKEKKQSVKSVVYKYTYILMMMMKKEKWAYVHSCTEESTAGWMDGGMVG